jgi:hypothetical protein
LAAIRTAVQTASLLVGVAVLALGGAPALGEEPDDTGRWIPAASLFGGFVAQRAAASVLSGEILGPGAPVPPEPVRPQVSGTDTMIAATVGGSLELTTPSFFRPGGQPRLFLHGDVAGAFGFKRTIAGEGKPEDMVFPPTLPPGTIDPGEEVITGQGSRTFAETKPLLITAGAGVAFTLALWDRTLRIKPSVEYIREEIEVTGLVHRAVQINSPSTGLEDFRLIELSASDSKVYHGIGPGIEFEADAARAGDFMLSVYLAGQGYYFLGDLAVEMSDTNEYGEIARWAFEKNPWGWGARVGLRFRWVPD